MSELSFVGGYCMCKILWEGANFISGERETNKKKCIISCDQSTVILTTAAPHYKRELTRLLLV